MAPRVATEADVESLTKTLTLAFEHDRSELTEEEEERLEPLIRSLRRTGEFSTPDGAHTVATMWREGSP